jgi:hypothetical protein
MIKIEKNQKATEVFLVRPLATTQKDPKSTATA